MDGVTKISEFDEMVAKRFRAGFEFPLIDDPAKDLKFLVFNEVFMLVKKFYPYNFNQNWTFFGFKKRFNSKAVLISGTTSVSDISIFFKDWLGFSIDIE